MQVTFKSYLNNVPRVLQVSSSSFSSGGRLFLSWPFRLQWLHFTLLRLLFFGLLTGGLRLLPSIKQPSVTMKTKAKKASSDSENIQSAYFVFDICEFLHLQWTPTWGTLICRFVSYVLVGLHQRPKRMTWFTASVCYPLLSYVGSGIRSSMLIM